MRGFRTVFDFTFHQQVSSAGYKRLTIILALILFLLPAVIMPVAELSRGSAEPEPEPSGPVDFAELPDEEYDAASEARELGLTKVYCVLQTEDVTIDGLREAVPILADVELEPLRLESSAFDREVPMLMIMEDEEGYTVGATAPDHAVEDALSFNVRMAFEDVLLASAGVPAETRQAYRDGFVTGQMDFSGSVPAPDGENGVDLIREILSMALPYVNVMLVYFLVLFYGQNTAGSVILEKTSKLMDTFLISVKPRAMIFGKVLAICASGILQFVIWVAAAVAGFGVGTALVRAINPDTTMGLVRFFSLLGSASGLFAPGAVILAVLLVMSGLLLYGAMASIGGALAGKPEELSSTNVFFTLILIASFFCTLYSGFLSGKHAPGVQWLDLVPFTSILITPSRLLLGDVPLWAGALSLVIVLAAAAVIMAAAGKIYRMMSFYKGNPPKIAQVVGMLREKQSEA